MILDQCFIGPSNEKILYDSSNFYILVILNTKYFFHSRNRKRTADKDLAENSANCESIRTSPKCPPVLKNSFECRSTINTSITSSQLLMNETLEISLLSEISNSFMKKYGMENISSLSTNNSIVGLENISPSAFSSPKEVSNGQENENFNHRDSRSSRNLLDVVDYSLARTSPLEDITNNIEHSEEKIQYTGSFSEEEPFVDSGSEYRPSTGISEDTDGDSFGKTYVIQAQEKNCELQEIAADMNVQMFDFKTPQTFKKPCNFVVQISNEDYIGKEAEISCNGDVSQTANQSAFSNMNQLDQLDSSLPSTSKSSGHDVC
ncbi:hypothetical protein JTB14_018480 [Gonioctena quinquepunctata]|nr:hypothetical protein JTB14_018480 [Gonioctena quinquepunctata]